MIYNSDSNN